MLIGCLSTLLYSKCEVVFKLHLKGLNCKTSLPYSPYQKKLPELEFKIEESEKITEWEEEGQMKKN